LPLKRCEEHKNQYTAQIRGKDAGRVADERNATQQKPKRELKPVSK
jgi:hypothetical protein